MILNILYKKNFLKKSRSKKIFKDSIKKIAAKITSEEEKDIETLSVIFCSDKFIKEYNKKYLGHDYETDIITFHDIDEKGLTEGELLISVETVEENSKRFKTDFEKELLRVIIHGLMHLCGYNDRTGSEKKIIKKKENYYLKDI
ncbi:MAG: rRNA maturation RNase YbeY [Bacteroidota bacterium]|nr:rRNA maturation RNase YbeY [Bacteroidota bacterium]